MSTPNWADLKASGRVKDIGLPWSEDEKKAKNELGIPVEFIRRGALTLEAFEELKAKDAKVLKKTGELPIEGQDLEELRKKAKKLKIQFTPDTLREALIREIIRAEEAVKADAEAKAKAKAEAKAAKEAKKAAEGKKK